MGSNNVNKSNKKPSSECFDIIKKLEYQKDYLVHHRVLVLYQYTTIMVSMVCKTFQ